MPHRIAPHWGHGWARLVLTSAGTVEIVHIPGERPPVLFFPGGHCSAATDCGWSLYAGLGHEVVSFSRPGYGGTRVGRLSAAEFTPLVGEVCEQFGISTIAASVGVSFGGLQAVHVAAGQRPTAQRLILHSCAPSVWPIRTAGQKTLLGPVRVRLTLSARPGLARNSGCDPVGRWPAHDDVAAVEPARQRVVGAYEPGPNKNEARGLFRSMRSDSGFVNDLRQGHARDADKRRAAMSSVHCPTLVTASRHDGGVSFKTRRRPSLAPSPTRGLSNSVRRATSSGLALRKRNWCRSSVPS